MKAVAIVFTFCYAGALAVLTAEQAAKLIVYKTQCMEETGVTMDTIEEAITGYLTGKNKPLDCFIACILKRFEILNADGTLNEQMAKQQAPTSISPENVDDMIEKCRGVSGTDDCDKAANLVECFFENKAIKLH